MRWCRGSKPAGAERLPKLWNIVPNSHGTAPSPERPLSAAGIYPAPQRDPGAPDPPRSSQTTNSPVSRRHDQSYKLLFSIPLAVDQLIRHFLDAGLADELDFKRVEILATERIEAGLVRSHADLLWKIHFRGSRRHLLLAIEFQSAVDRFMAVRIHHYVGAAYHGLTAAKPHSGELAPGDR